MDTALIVFAVGTAASFVPMYWVAARLMGRRRKPATITLQLPKARTEPAGRREFMDLLRQEAGNRAVAVLRDALAEARLAAQEAFGDGLALSTRTRLRLDETRRLVDSLFPHDLQQAFERGIETLTAASSHSIGTASATATATIAVFEHALQNDAARPATRALTRPGIWETIRQKGRGWTGAGNVGAAA